MALTLGLKNGPLLTLTGPRSLTGPHSCSVTLHVWGPFTGHCTTLALNGIHLCMSTCPTSLGSLISSMVSYLSSLSTHPLFSCHVCLFSLHSFLFSFLSALFSHPSSLIANISSRISHLSSLFSLLDRLFTSPHLSSLFSLQPCLFPHISSKMSLPLLSSLFFVCIHSSLISLLSLSSSLISLLTSLFCLLASLFCLLPSRVTRLTFHFSHLSCLMSTPSWFLGLFGLVLRTIDPVHTDVLRALLWG